MPIRRCLLPLLFLATFLGGCGAGLRLTPIEASVRKPSNVAIYFTVDTADGEPVPGLTAQSFRIYEDDQPVSLHESKQTILNPEVVAAHYTLLLIDMSGSITESGDVPVVIESARAFGERVQRYQKVAVFAFDGSTRIYPITNFTTGPALASGVSRLGRFQARDPSTNLNGAILEAIKVLRRQMVASPAPLTFGTLVVFTDGTDRAHRIPHEHLHKQLEAAEDLEVMVIGVGSEIDEGELRAIGKSGSILSKDRARITSSFEAAAARVEAFSRRYYLLGYCSPARAGKHQVRIETTAAGRSGSLVYNFDATGFGPNCNPTQRPAFNVRRPGAGKRRRR